MVGPFLNLHMANTIPSDIPELLLTKSIFYLCYPGPYWAAPLGVLFPLYSYISTISLPWTFPAWSDYPLVMAGSPLPLSSSFLAQES